MINLHEELETTIFKIEKSKDGKKWKTCEYFINKLTPDIVCSCNNKNPSPFGLAYVFDETNDEEVGLELNWEDLDELGFRLTFRKYGILKGMFEIAFEMGTCKVFIDESALFYCKDDKPYFLRITKVDKVPRIDIAATIQEEWFSRNCNKDMEHLVFLAGESVANHIENFGIENPYKKEDNDE